VFLSFHPIRNAPVRSLRGGMNGFFREIMALHARV
jgi:hypothetical protein